MEEVLKKQYKSPIIDTEQCYFCSCMCEQKLIEYRPVAEETDTTINVPVCPMCRTKNYEDEEDIAFADKCEREKMETYFNNVI